MRARTHHARNINAPEGGVPPEENPAYILDGGGPYPGRSNTAVRVGGGFTLVPAVEVTSANATAVVAQYANILCWEGGGRRKGRGQCQLCLKLSMKDMDVALHLTTRGSFRKMSTKWCEETLQPHWGTSNLSSYFSMKKMTSTF